MHPASLTRLLLLSYPVLAFVTWIASVMMPHWAGHSLLSPESMRHLATHSVGYTAPWLLYALLAAISIGNIRYIIRQKKTTPRTTHYTIYIYIAIEVVLCLGLVWLLMLQSDAPLRGIDGRWASPHSIAIAPTLALLLLILLTTLVARHIHTINTWREAYSLWLTGMKALVPYALPIALTAHLTHTIIYLLGG